MSIATQMRRAAAGVSAGGFDPLSFGSPLHAYWAEDPSWSNPGDGGAVASWPSAGSAGLTLAQGTGAARPLWRSSGINGRASVDFDGSDDVLSATGGSVQGAFTMVAVYKFGATGDTFDWVVGSWDGGSNNLVGLREGNSGELEYLSNGEFVVQPTIDTDPHVFVAEQQGSPGFALTVNLDGSPVVNDFATESVGANLYMGALGANHADCHVAFWAVYASAVLGASWWSELEDGLIDYYGTA